ncbi:MAG TPA: hypothetical protein PK542_08315 [Treponemataceae bacterium]|nr:hypothetical protein [Treponemataceae bacterium]
MKKARFVCLSLVTAITFLSCLSTPPAKPDAKAAPAASESAQAPASDANSPEATEATAPAESAAAPGENPAPSSDVAVTGDEGLAPETVAPTDEGLAPVGEAEAPEVPPSERLLYFYPEPDATLSAPPAKEPTPAEKPAAPKPVVTKPAVTAPVPAPKAPEKAKPAVAEKPKAKAADKAQVKTAAEGASGGATAEILPGIWKSEPTAPTQAPEKASAVPAVAHQPPSRQTTIPAGQTLEVWYPGSGWVFLGDASAQNGLGYENRKLDKADTLFTFKALKPGNYILDFSRFDVLDDSFMQDSLAVTVTDEAPIRTGRIRAPDYRAAAKATGAVQPGVAQAGVAPIGVAPTTAQGSSVQAGSVVNGNAAGNVAAATPAARGNSSQPIAGSGQQLYPSRGANPPMSDEPAVTSATSGLAPQGNAVADIPTDPDAILKKAQSSLASGDAASALSLLDAFFTTAVSSLDEGWYLRGQAYESNGASRDIRKALDAYQTLVQAYPDSPRWKSADERIRYIKQFYQKIR